MAEIVKTHLDFALKLEFTHMKNRADTIAKTRSIAGDQSVENHRGGGFATCP
jgi:hypothetical protein